MRATTSTPEPAGKPIRMVMGLFGQSCAEAEAAERKSAARNAANEPTRAFSMVVSSRSG